MASDRRSTFSAAILVTSSTYISYGLGLLVGAVISRHLGPTAYGRYAYLVWLSGWLVVVANHGLTTSGIRFVAECVGKGSIEAAGRVYDHLLRWQVASIGVVVVFFGLAVWVGQPTDWTGNLWYFGVAIALCAAARALYLFQVSIAKGYGQFQVEAYSTLALAVFNVCAVVALSLANAGLRQYVMLFVISSLATGAMAWLHLNRTGIRPVRHGGSASLPVELHAHMWWTMLLVLVSSLGGRSIETMALNYFADPAQVGFFTLASGLTRGSIDLLTVGLTTVLMPTMSRAFGAGGSERVKAIFRDAVRYFVFFGLILAGVGAFWSRPIVALLYGDEYLSVVPALAIFQIVGGLTLSEAAFGALLTTTGSQSVRARISFVSLVVSATLALSLVPQFGLSGAVISSSVARVLVFLVLTITTVRTRPVELPISAIGRLAASALLAAFAGYVPVFAMGETPGHLLGGLLYLGAFAFATVGLGAWQPRDVGLLIRAAKTHPRYFGRCVPVLENWASRIRLK